MLSLENVNAYYDSMCALSGVSMKLHQGEIITVIGANGAGKSTLLKVIMGLVPAKSGKVVLEGHDITIRATEEIVNLGVSLIPEGRETFTNLTVMENLRIGAYCQRANKKDIENEINHVFELFPVLAERRNQVAGTLSGGERQMLAIGRGLMSKPKLLLLDEPSMGLSSRVIHAVFSQIQKLNKEGMTVLLAEQNCRMALTIAHRGYVLHNGKVALEDKSGNLLNNKMVQELYLGGAVTTK